jgi:hypothetical protein
LLTLSEEGGDTLLTNVIEHIGAETVFSLDELTSLQSNHRLMTLYLRAVRERLATFEDVRKYQDNIAAILRAAHVALSLTDDVWRNAEDINRILHTVRGGEHRNADGRRK